MPTLPGAPTPRLRPKTQQRPNLRNAADVPPPDMLTTADGAENFYPHLRPTIDLGATGNTDVTPRLREDIPVPTEANLYGADALSSPPPELDGFVPPDGQYATAWKGSTFNSADSPDFDPSKPTAYRDQFGEWSVNDTNDAKAKWSPDELEKLFAKQRPPADIIRDQHLADAKKANPDVQFAPGVTGDMIFRTQTRANERTIEADKLTGFAPRPDFRTPLGMASNDSVDLTRTKLERLNGTRPDSWMFDAHVASRVTGTSDAPVAVGPDGTYDDFLKNRYAGITNDQALDGLMRPKFDELAKVNPIAAANGTNIGDTWRTVQVLGNGAPIAPAPKPPSDPLMDAGQAAHDAVFSALGSAGDVANELLGIKSAKGQTASPAKPQPMTPEQAMQYLTGSNKAAPPPTKGPLDVMWEVAGNATKTVGANTFDAVANISQGAYLGVKTALDGIDGITSGIAGYAGDKTGIEFLKEYAKGGLGLPGLPDPVTPAGQVSRGVSEFLTGYYLGGKVLSAFGVPEATSVVAGAARTLAQGAIADAGFFDGQSGKLADLLVQVPALQNPVTDFLATNPNDGEAEGRFKNALNGILAAPLVPAFVASVRGLRARMVAFRNVPREVPNMQGGGANPFTRPAPAPAAPRSLLGDVTPDAPLTVVPASQTATKLATARAEVSASGGAANAVPSVQVGVAPIDRLLNDPETLAKVVGKTKPDATGQKIEDRFSAHDDALSALQDIHDEIAAITPEERAALGANEMFSSEANLPVAQTAVAKSANALRDQIVALHDDAALLLGMPKIGKTIGAASSLTSDQAKAVSDAVWNAQAGKDAFKIGDLTSSLQIAVEDGDPSAIKSLLTQIEAETRGTLGTIDPQLGIKAKTPASATPALSSSAATVPASTVGLTPLGGGPSGGPQVFANFAAIKTPDDLQSIANNLIAAYEGTTDAARQGIVTNAQTKAAAGSIDAFDTLLSRKTGDAPNAAQVYAWKSLYLGSLSKLQEVAKKASTSSLADAPAALLQMREMESVVLAVQKEFYGARAESGRALQAFKIPPDSVFAAKQVQNLLNAYGGIDANVDLARKLAAIDDPKALADFVESTVFTKSKDAWQQYYYASILSSPKTHIRNFVGNTVMMGMNIAETGLASQFSAAMGSDAVKGGEAIANWYGIKAAFGDALQAASRTWKTGESTGGYGLNKVDFPQRNAISATTWNLAPTSTFGRAVDALGAVTMIPSRLLSSSDEFFKTVGASGTGYQMAFRQAQSEVAKGTLQPDQVAARVTQLVSDFPNRLDDATKAAVADKAAYLTFTTPPKQGGWVDLLLKIRAVGDQPDASLISKAGGLAARTVIPFVNTPANIMLATFERTPLAPLTARYRDAMAEGGAAAYTANAKMALGTMSMATWTDMAMNGQVTGQGPPSNTAEYQALYATGWRPYSVKFGDHYVSYQGLEPLSTVLGWSATIGEMMSNADTTSDPTAQANIEKAVTATVFALGDVVLSKTYLSSSADLLDAINSGDPSSAEYFIKKYGAGMLVPNIVKDANTIVDPAQKYTTSILDEAKSRIPGLSGDLPPRRDAFGFVKSYQSGFGSAYDAISPFFASQVKDLPVASAMLKDGWAISTPPMAFSIDGQRVDVSNQPVVYSRFLELRGQVKPSDMTDRVTPIFTAADRYGSGDAALAWSERLKDRYGDRSMTDALNSIVSEAPPQDLRDMADKYHTFTNADDRRKFILNIVSDYQDAAKAVLFSEYPQLPARAAQLKAAGQEAQP